MENTYGDGERPYDHEDPHLGIVLEDILVKSGVTLLVDHHMEGDNSKHEAGPFFLTLPEALQKLQVSLAFLGT